MRSRIFQCQVLHHRFEPRRHRFRYPIFMLALDLDELDQLAQTHRVLRINRPGLLGFRESDYLPIGEEVFNRSSPPRFRAGGARSLRRLRERVAALLADHAACDELPSRVELVTMPRVFGYAFNPVSFYFCYDAFDQPIAAIAEVTNTFREVKPFILPRSSLAHGAFRLRLPKHFYVSPYSDVDVAFDFALRPGADRICVRIDDYAHSTRTLTSVLSGRSRPLRDATLAWFLVRYPCLSLGVITRIHWHALRLYWKGVPWFRKSARAGDQRDLFRPHRSLAESGTVPTRSVHVS